MEKEVMELINISLKEDEKMEYRLAEIENDAFVRVVRDGIYSANAKIEKIVSSIKDSESFEALKQYSTILNTIEEKHRIHSDVDKVYYGLYGY